MSKRMKFLRAGASTAVMALLAGSALAQQAANGGDETVIVTGTRVQGMTAADSAAPITVLGTDALTKGTGTADLRQALGQVVPSFTAQQFGADTANLTLSAALRGLSPNATLVLVNGHRRHYTGNLHVNGGDFASGSAAPDISLIPRDAIDHVEVLLDGAAAQYGTDAIAGVINIILKKKSAGGQLAASAGRNYDREGETYDIAYNMGLPLFDKGFANITVEKGYHNFTQNGGADNRYANAAGLVPSATVTGFDPVTGIARLSAGVPVPPANLALVKNYPRANPAYGDAESQLTMAAVNAGYDFSDHVQLYAFGTLAHRYGRGHENVRLPNQIIAMPGSSQPCSATNPNGYNTAATASGTPVCALGINGGVRPVPGAVGYTGLNGNGIIISQPAASNPFAPGTTYNLYTPGVLVLYPGGFQPLEGLKEDDYQYNIGLKFDIAGWDVDANVGYGKDIDKIYTLNSGNRSLFIDTHTTPTDFYDGSFTASQFTGTIDATHQFNIGMASPLTVAVGIEAREDFYGISAGDPASYYKEGAQSFPGFQPSTAGNHSRKNYAGYIDFALAPIETLQLDIAGRAEHYSDFGDTQIGKLTARYDFAPEFAVRGTISTGFRAPTLAEEFYTATVVSPTNATVQLPANSVAAKVLGLTNLKPEISTSFSAGIVAHPLSDLSITIDAYSITLGNRIVAPGTLYGKGGTPLVPLVNDAIAANGNILDPTVTRAGVSAFLNGVNTLTEGIDFTVSYPTDLGDAGLIDWTLAGNFNQTTISSIIPTPSVILAQNPSATLLTVARLYGFVHSAPQEKIGLTANWSLDGFGATLRETYYGPQHGYTAPGGCLTLATCYAANQAGVGITDLEVRYNVTEQLQFALGGNNLFGIRPDPLGFASPVATGTSSGNPADGANLNNRPIGSAFTPNGGYYYGRITFNF